MAIVNESMKLARRMLVDMRAGIRRVGRVRDRLESDVTRRGKPWKSEEKLKGVVRMRKS